MKRNLLLVLFSVFCFSAVTAAELNIYASGLRVNSVDEANQVSISYFLNAPATALEFQLLRDDGSIYRAVPITTAGALTKGQHDAVIIDLSTARGGTYHWALKATAAATSLTKISDTSTRFNFYSPQGLAVDNSPESDYFGRIYLAESMSATTAAGREKTEGIYIFGPTLTDITSQGNSAYNGSVSWNADASTEVANTGGLKWDGTGPARLSVADDGCVFICDNGRVSASVSTSGVWMLDPSSPSTSFKEVLDISERGTIFNRANSCVAIGSGAEKELYMIDWSDSIMRFPVGNCATPYSTRGTTWRNNLASFKIVNAFNTLARGVNGDFWVFQFRGQLDTYPIVTHFNSSASRDFYISSESNSSLAPSSNPCRRGSGAVSPDGSKLAFYGNTTMYIYDVAYNANGVPSLSNKQTIASVGGSNVDAIAFDVANNLYFASASKEYFFAYSTPKTDNSCTTPAASSRTITITQKTQSPMAGTYKIGKGLYPEIAYTSLNDAATDVNAWGMSADVTLLICDDLTENNNSGLVNTSDHTLTIRPDGTTKRTITFGSAPDNAGPSGHIVIGYNLTGWNSIDTKNVIIDGSYNEEGQYLEFQAGSIGGRTIVFYGNVTDTEVRNCRIINNRASSTNYAIELRTTQLAGGNPPTDANKTDKAPVGIRIENCFVQVTGSGNAQAININGAYSKTSAGMPKDTYIGGCEIIANLRGIFINGAINANIEGNIFRVNATGGYNTGIIYGNNSSGDINIRNNQFLQIATKNTNSGTYGIHAVFAQSGGNWKIENNLFTGFDAGVKDAKGNLVGIFVNSTPSSVTIQHNTMVMPAFTKAFTSPDLLSTTPVTLIRVAAGTPVIKNNILISHETTCVNSLIRGNLNANCLNNVYYSAGGSGVIVDGATACANWSEFTTKYSTQAASSQNVDVTFSGSEPYMLSAESANEAKLEVPNIDGLTTDIEGNTRYTPTHAGCYDLAWTLTLDETATNNSDAIEAKDERVMNVLFNRRFSVDAGLYTLVLPFDLTDEQLQEAFGADYQLSVLHDAYMKTPELMYLKFDHVNNLIAGEPCLLQVSKDVNEDILFRDVTIDKTDRSIQFAGDHDIARMIGLYDQTDIPASAKDYYLGNNNYLFQYKSTTTTKGFRAYFHFPDFGAGAPPRARVVFHDDTTTDVEPVEATPAAIEPQKVIRNGELIIIVNGVEYDVTGRVRVR